MTITKKGWQERCMMSLFKKEGSYDAGANMASANACEMTGFEVDLKWSDKIVSDKDLLTGYEHGSTQERIQYGAEITYKQARATPNALIGLAALVLGNDTPSQDSNLTAYSHKIIPVTIGTALPSMQVENLKGGLQYKYTGIKGNTLKISGEEGGFVAIEAGLIGSGTRATSAANFANKVSESWLKLSNCKVWMEDGVNIVISANLVQDAEDISNATPANLYPRLKSFEWSWDNALAGQYGFGSANEVFQDMDYGRRKSELKFSLLFYDETELAYFISQTPLAIEFDLKGALIAANGTMYYGVQLIVPKFMLKSAPLPKGGVNDILTCDFDCEVFEDGTNSPVILVGYNSKAAYLAA